MYSDELGKISFCQLDLQVGAIAIPNLNTCFLGGAQPIISIRDARECFYPAIVSRTPKTIWRKFVKYVPLMEIDVWRGEKVRRSCSTANGMRLLVMVPRPWPFLPLLFLV